MAARLGNVIYWIGLVVAILAGLLAVMMFWFWYNDGPIPGPPLNSLETVKNVEAWRNAELRATLLLAGISVGSFLIGRAARYIFAGR